MKPVFARQMEVYAGFLEHTDHHVGRLIDALAELEILDDTLVYVIIGDNGASAEGTPNGCFNELIVLNGAFGLETVDFMTSRIDGLRRTQGLQPLRRRLGARHGCAVPMDEAGRVALGRHAQRHDRALAEGHRGEGRGADTVPPRHRRRRDRPRRGRRSRAHVRPRHPADAAARRLDGAVLRRRLLAGASRDAVLRDVLQPRHLPQGLDRRHAAQHALGDGGEPATRRGRLGALRPGRLDAGARPLRGEPGEAQRAADAVPDRSGEVQRPAARRPPGGTLQPRSRRPAATGPRHPPAPLRRHGPPLGELGRRASRTSRTR